MAITKIQSESLNLADTYAFTGTVTGAGAIPYTPAFFARSSSTQSLTSNSTTKVTLDTEVIDTDNAFDNSTNYRFTVPSGKAGKYFFYASVDIILTSNDMKQEYIYIYKNGSSLELKSFHGNGNANLRRIVLNYSTVLDLSAGDYIEIYTYQESASSGSGEIRSNNNATHFGGYKIG